MLSKKHSKIDFQCHTINLYDMKYFSREYNDCSHKYVKCIKYFCVIINRLDLFTTLNSTVILLMEISQSYKIYFNL